MNDSSKSLNLIFKILPFLICIVLFFCHLIAIHFYSVNIPYWDEWGALLPNALGHDIDWQWIFAQSNEHRIVFTKLLNWLLYRLDGWNVVTSIYLNMSLYVGLLLIIFRFLRELGPEDEDKVKWFVPFLLSTAAVENFNWSFQSQFHFFIGFFLLAVYFLMLKPISTRNAALGVLFSLFSIYSFSAGIICSLVLMSMLILRILVEPGEKSRKNRGFLAAFFILLAIGSWFAIGYTKPSGHPVLFYFWQRPFINYFFNIIAGGFGILKVFWPIGFVYFIWSAFPLLYFARPRAQRSPLVWSLMTITIMVYFVFASIAMGRAGFGMEQSKSSRYAEIGMLLIPVGAALWALILRNFPAKYRQLMLVFWIVIFCSFTRHWNARVYRITSMDRSQGVECVREFYLEHGSGICPQLYPSDISNRLENAKALNISFYREITQ